MVSVIDTLGVISSLCISISSIFPLLPAVELVENGDIVQPKCKYNGDKLDCNFTWAANSSYETDLNVICPSQEGREDIVSH